MCIRDRAYETARDHLSSAQEELAELLRLLPEPAPSSEPGSDLAEPGDPGPGLSDEQRLLRLQRELLSFIPRGAQVGGLASEMAAQAVSTLVSDVYCFHAGVPVAGSAPGAALAAVPQVLQPGAGWQGGMVAALELSLIHISEPTRPY